MEHVLRNSLYALLERDDAKLPDILHDCIQMTIIARRSRPVAFR